MRSLAFIVALLLLSGTASAQSRPDIARTYEGKDPWSIEVRTIMLDPDSGAVAAQVTIATPGCLGDFAGTGTLSGTVLELRPSKPEEGSEDCVVTMTFDKTGKTATLAEDQCSYFHGMQCEFSGKVKAKR
jgi:hypothetical protein